METKSWRLLQDLAPESWILRESSERDYGIDAYIELVSPESEISGGMASLYLERDWKVAPLSKFYISDRETWQDQSVFLHEDRLNNLLDSLKGIYPRLARKALNLISLKHGYYWMKRDPILFSLCAGGALEEMVRELEKKLA